MLPVMWSAASAWLAVSVVGIGSQGKARDMVTRLPADRLDVHPVLWHLVRRCVLNRIYYLNPK